MMLIRSLIAVLRRIPRLIADELEEREFRAALERRWRESLAEATWQCQLHGGDVWRGPDGRFRKVTGTFIAPITEWQAEDFHGYAAAAPADDPLRVAIEEQLRVMLADEEAS